MKKAVALLFLIPALFLWGPGREKRITKVEPVTSPLPTPSVIYKQVKKTPTLVGDELTHESASWRTNNSQANLLVKLEDTTALAVELYRGPREKKEIALTFDADMTEGMKKRLLSGKVSSWYNKEVIDELAATRTPATLFLTGMWIELYPKATKELALNPLFELGNHSYSHPSFSGRCFRLRQIPDSQDEAEIEKTQRLLKQVAGVDNKLFRFPGGCFDKFDIETVTRLGLVVVEWDVESGDAFNSNSKAIVRRVLGQAQNGSIVVFHLHGGPNAPATALALPEIILGLKKRGYSLVKVSQLIEF